MNEPNGVSYILNKHENIRRRRQVRKRNLRIFSVSFIILTLAVAYFYYYSRFSRIQYIIVEGNHYLTRNDVIELAKLDEDDLYLLAFSRRIVKNVSQHPIIQHVEVQKGPSRTVTIRIAEKRILGYLYQGDAYLLLDDGQRMLMESDKLRIIAEIPLIEGFENEELLTDLAQALGSIDDTMRQNISEIHRYRTSYDENMLKIAMNDGNYFFTGMSTTAQINSYFDILNVLKVSNSCIFIDEISKTPYSTVCPKSEDASLEQGKTE